MTQLIQAYESISVPAGLEQAILSACLAEKPLSPSRYRVPLVSTAAAAAVLLTTLSASGWLDTWLTQVEDWIIGPDEMVVVTPDGQSPKPPETSANTTPEGPNTTTNTSLTLSTTPTTVGKPTTVAKEETVTTAAVVSPTVTTGDMAYCKHAFPGDEEFMTLSQLEAYFGRRIRPAWVPQDLKQQTLSIGYSVWHRNEEKMSHLSPYDKEQFEEGNLRDASVIYDRNTILYRGKEDRELSVAMSTAPYPRNQLGDMSRFDETVTVAGVTVKLAYYDDSVYAGKTLYSYTALFTVDGIAFCVNGWNLPRQEFLDVVESIIE